MAAAKQTAAAAKGEPPKGTPNPWDSKTWNLTKQMTFFKQFGPDVAREWAAAAGTTLGGERPKKKEPKDGAPGPQGPRGRKGNDGDGTGDGTTGATGPAGDQGWSPIFAVITDGQRRVLQIVDWTGGSGSEPTAGDYIGPTGPVGDIADAVDLRGTIGATGPTGPAGDDGTGGGSTVYDLPMFFAGDIPNDGTVMGEHVAARDFTLANDFFPSTAILQVAVHTEELAFPVYQNETLIGTIVFAIGVDVQVDGSQRGTFVGGASDFVFTRWDRLRVLAPLALDDVAHGFVATFAVGISGTIETFDRITEIGDRRITEDGDVRILENAP